MGKIRESRLRSTGRVHRRRNDYLARKKTMALMVGKSKRRLKRPWSDCVIEGLNSIGTAGEDTQDRVSWRKGVSTGDTAQGDNP